MIRPEDGFQQLLDGLVVRRGIHHALLAIESGDGSLKWAGTAGEADPSGRPMTPQTPYFIASVTKLYYAAMVLRLAERGLVDVDAPFTRYLDQSLTDRLHVMAGTDRTGQVTVRNLASHTSGLPDYIEDKPKKGPRFIDRVLAEGDRELPLTEVLRMVREELEPHFPPQDLAAGGRVRARYSDTNFALLRAIIEAVTGRDWPDALAFELLKPLDLRHTWVVGSDPLEQPPVAAAALWGGLEPLEIPRLLASVGDLYSTVTDQMAFIRALVNGSAFDNASSARAMWTGWHTLGFDPTTPRLAGWPIAYAFGSMRFALPRWLTPFGTVPAVEGHSGSTGCWLYYAWTWSMWGVAVATGLSAAEPPGSLLYLLGVFGPLAGAAWIVRRGGRAYRRAFLRRIWDPRRVPAIRWLALPAVAAGPALIGAAVASLTGTTVNAVDYGAGSVGAAIAVALIAGLVEEPGWRGAASDAWQTRTHPVWAAAGIGVLWSLWHLPLHLFEGSWYHDMGIGSVRFWLVHLLLVQLGVLYAWLANGSGGSILLAILAHAGFNIAAGLVPSSTTRDVVAFVAVTTVTVFIIVATKGRLAFATPE